MELQTKCLKLGEKTKAGHIYDRKMFEKALAKYKDTRGGYGMVGPRESIDAPLMHVSHIVKNAFIDDNNEVNLDVEILETPQGKIVQEMIKQDCQFRFEPTGMGQVNEKGEVTDYTLLGFDIMC